MRPSLILVPFAGMFVLTLVVWVTMFARRIAVIRASGIQPRTRADLDQFPAPAVNASNNLQNLFELPVIFYACVLALLVSQRVDTAHVVCAFGFFAFRVAHSTIHCTYNEVIHRFGVYMVAGLFLWTMVLRLAIGVLGDAFA
jgi:hypothetical protein